MARYPVFQRVAHAIVLTAFFFTFGCGSEDPFLETIPSQSESPLSFTSLDDGILLVRSAANPSEADLSGILQEVQAAEELRRPSFLVVLPDGEPGTRVVQSLLGVTDFSDPHRLREKLFPEKVYQNLQDRLHVAKKDLGAQGPAALLVLSEEGIEVYVNQAEGMGEALGLNVPGGEFAPGDLGLIIGCIVMFVMLSILCALVILSNPDSDRSIAECVEDLWTALWWLAAICSQFLPL